MYYSVNLGQPSWKTHEFSMKNSYRKLPIWDILTMWYFKKSILFNACAWRAPLKGVDFQLNNQLNTMFCSHPLKLFKYDDFYHFGTFWQTIILTSILNHYSAKWLKCINDLNLFTATILRRRFWEINDWNVNNLMPQLQLFCIITHLLTVTILLLVCFSRKLMVYVYKAYSWNLPELIWY